MPAVTKAKEPERQDVERTAEPDVPMLPWVEEPPALEQFNVLLYGPPGAGKSTAAATAPGPILWVNAEGGNALAYARKMATERGSRILEIRIDPRQNPTPVKATLEEVYRYVKSGVEPRPATVVVDTIAKLREALASQIVVPGAKNTMQQWGDVAKALGGFIKAFRDLPVNLILLAHEDVSDVEDERLVRPLIGGALSATIPGEVDVVAYCRAVRAEDGVQYLGQLVEARGRYAKDRSGGLGTTRALDLSEWLGAFREALGVTPVPWETDEDAAAGERTAEDESLLAELPK